MPTSMIFIYTLSLTQLMYVKMGFLIDLDRSPLLKVQIQQKAKQKVYISKLICASRSNENNKNNNYNKIDKS